VPVLLRGIVDVLMSYFLVAATVVALPAVTGKARPTIVGRVSRKGVESGTQPVSTGRRARLREHLFDQ
jgi:hypothetical protein